MVSPLIKFPAFITHFFRQVQELATHFDDFSQEKLLFSKLKKKALLC